MSRGLSRQQREVVALLVTAKRSLDVTGEVLPMLEIEPTDSARRAMLRAVHSLEARGLVSVEKAPAGRGGWPTTLATARRGASGEVTGADLHRARTILGPEVALNGSGHGHARAGRESGAYISWKSMVKRCTNPNAKDWPDYGGRGIEVCDRWREFQNFLADMGERPAGMTLDRIDVDGNYELANCRWATPSEQRRNQRRVRSAQANGKAEGTLTPDGVAG